MNSLGCQSPHPSTPVHKPGRAADGIAVEQGLEVSMAGTSSSAYRPFQAPCTDTISNNRSCFLRQIVSYRFAVHGLVLHDDCGLMCLAATSLY